MDVCGNSDEAIINIQTKTKKLVSLKKRGINMYFYTNPLNNIYWPTDSDGMSSTSLKQSLNCCLRGTNYILVFCGMKILLFSGAPARAKRAWDRAPYSRNMVNLFSLGCHVSDRTYVRTYASTDCTGRVGETIKRKGGVSQACLGKSPSFI